MTNDYATLSRSELPRLFNWCYGFSTLFPAIEQVAPRIGKAGLCFW